MAVGSAISSPLCPASCDKDAKALQFIEEPTRNADLVPERVSAEILPRNANTEYPNGDHSPNLSAHPSPELPTMVPERVSAEILPRNANTEYPNGDRSPNLSAHPSPELPTMVPERVSAEILPRNANTEYPNGDRSPYLSAHPSPQLPTSVTSDEAVSSTTRLKAFISKAFHGMSTSFKKAVIKVGESIYKARDFLLNRRGGGGGGGEGGGGGGGGGEGGDGEEGDVEGVDGEEGDVEGVGGDKKKSRPTPQMLLVIATTTIANTAQTFGSAISLKVRDLALANKVLLILVMANGLAGYLFSITAISLMHKRPRFSRVWVWTGCASTTLGFLILIAAFVLEL